MTEKLELLKQDKTQSEGWQRLHEERILTLKDDAPPSIRQKVQRTVSVAREMLKQQNVSNNPPIEHIGIETARFDISSLAQGEGKKLKKKLKAKQYQQSAGGDRDSLINDQNGSCIFCGELLSGDTHIDHLFPKAKGGGNVALNKVVGHSFCNIDKHKNSVPLNSSVLDSIKQNNKKKYDFIKKRLESDGKLPEDMLAAPQHTMFGAKLLKGALMEEFNVSPEKIPKIRAEDVRYLRRWWFPFMDRQKGAIRNKSKSEFKAKVQEQYKLDIGKLKLDKDLFPDDADLSIERLDGSGDKWLERNKNEIVGTPKSGDEGTNKFLLKSESKKFILEAVKISDDEDENKAEKLLTGELGIPLKLPLKDLFSKDKATKKLLGNSDVYAQVEFRKRDKASGNDWLQVEGDTFIGTPNTCPYEDGKRSYVPWCDVKITDCNTGEIVEIKIKISIGQRVLPVIVEPSADDPVRDFHHALDAVILAANVDWKKIGCLSKDIRKGNYLERIKMIEQSEESHIPSFISPMKEDGRGNLLAPKKTSDWYVKDKIRKDLPKSSKTTLEPLRVIKVDDVDKRGNVKKDKKGNVKKKFIVAQRKPLEKIFRKNVGNIVNSPEVKSKMEEAWEEVEEMSDEQKKNIVNKEGKEQKLSHCYFLNLDKDHILHPSNTRSVLCEIGGTGLSSMFELEDKKTKGKHNFERKVYWQEAKVLKWMDEKGREKTGVFRFVPVFYWRDKDMPTHERNEIDKKPPDNYEVLATFKRGDLVEVEQKSGKWKISKLGSRATVENTENLETVTSAYAKLKKIKS